MTLLADHQALIAASAISPDVAAARGYFSATKKVELTELGFARNQARVPALVIPVCNVFGEIATYLARPDEPRVKDGRTLKYEIPSGSRMVLDVPPSIRPQLADPSVPLLITEGARKADAAVSAGLCCVALIGTWAWRGTNAHGGKTLLPDFEVIAFNGRPTYVVFDSDVMTKESVHAALERFVPVLKQRDAQVQAIYLPPGDDGSKVGLDDFLASGQTAADLFALAESELRPLPVQAHFRPYEATAEGLVWNRREGNHVVPTPLTNFDAQIVADVVRDDGAEQQRLFDITADVQGRRSGFRIPARDFESMSWVLEHVGARAVVAPGYVSREHARAAIQLLSNPVELRCYAHLGWLHVDGRWMYLHAGGGISEDGANDAVEVDVDGALDRFRLPSPPGGDDLSAAVQASLSLLEAAPLRVAVPVLAAVYRAPLGPCPYALHLTGYTGAGKSTFAALAQQHYGAGMDIEHLPGSWTSTANHLEGLLFAAKDALTVVDDLTLGESRRDREQAQRLAERVYRAQGNQQGRGRMRADATLKPTKYPRGLVLGTSEDLPAGQSLRARILIIEFAPDTLNWPRISDLQRDAATGLFADALAGYIRWLAVDHDAFRRELKTKTEQYRRRAQDSRYHRRTPDLIASLYLGFHTMLDFAREIDAITPQEAEVLAEEGWAALGEAAEAQLPHQKAADLPGRFVELVRSALTAGNVHIADADTGREPQDAARWGWRKIEQTLETTWQPQGKQIGWLDGEDLFLDPHLALGAAQRVAGDLAEHLGITTTTLAKQLHERSLLQATELTTRQTYTIRRTLSGSRVQVLHLRADTINPTGRAPHPTSPTVDPTSSDPSDTGPHGPSGRAGQVTEPTTPPLETDAGPHSPATPTAGPSPRPPAPDQPDPCPYDNHRTSDWSLPGGPRVCGICHPPATESLLAPRVGRRSPYDEDR